MQMTLKRLAFIIAIMGISPGLPWADNYYHRRVGGRVINNGDKRDLMSEYRNYSTKLPFVTRFLTRIKFIGQIVVPPRLFVSPSSWGGDHWPISQRNFPSRLCAQPGPLPLNGGLIRAGDGVEKLQIKDPLPMTVEQAGEFRGMCQDGTL